jgi:peptidoglycan/LPS O-acetylase OafA/YrhL
LPRCDAVDWLKAIGITAIVYGHVAHATTVPLTPPIYLKQFGVALFLFATGFTLAREQRSPAAVVIKRLTPVYVLGLGMAALMTAIGLASGSGLAPSNYLPFFGGANVLFNGFPANPTTWYLGTYVHALLLWALLLRRGRITMALALAMLAIEIPVRTMLIAWAGPYIAYMMLTNWLAVFLAGIAWGARPDHQPRGSSAPYLAALGGGLAAWALTMKAVGFTPAFPFMTIDRWPLLAGTVAISAAASILYLSATLLTFGAMRRVPAPGPVRFLSRHSLVIVLAHMPIFFALNPVLSVMGVSYAAKVVIHMVIYLPGLAWLSAIVVRVVQPNAIADRLLVVFLDRPAKRTSSPGSMPSLEHR